MKKVFITVRKRKPERGFKKGRKPSRRKRRSMVRRRRNPKKGRYREWEKEKKRSFPRWRMATILTRIKIEKRSLIWKEGFVEETMKIDEIRFFIEK